MIRVSYLEELLTEIKEEKHSFDVTKTERVFFNVLNGIKKIDYKTYLIYGRVYNAITRQKEEDYYSKIKRGIN